MTPMPKLVMFDMDGTLARSKEPLDASMSILLGGLLERTKVAVISGGAFERFLVQIIDRLPENAQLEHLFILPTSGAMLYEWQNGTWNKIYEERIPENAVDSIEKAVLDACIDTGLVDLAVPSYGERLEYRGGQVTFSVLGQHAPIEEKEAWDPDKTKRRVLRRAIAARLPLGYTATMGGKTSIDITKNGVDKAYGIRKLAERLRIPESDIWYVGDELGRDGNDEAAYKTGVQEHPITHPADTEALIRGLIESADAP